MEGFTQANLFELSSNSIHVTFSGTGILGGPILSYRDNQFSRSFRGEEIRLQETELGQLITVTIGSNSRPTNRYLFVGFTYSHRNAPVYWNTYQGPWTHHHKSNNNCWTTARSAKTLFRRQSERNCPVHCVLA